MKSNRRSLFLFGKGVEGEMKWGTLIIACTPVHWELQSQHKDVCHVLHFWGLAQKTLSESRADGWCGNAERMCVCACMGKNVKGGGWGVHAEVFPCSTAQGSQSTQGSAQPPTDAVCVPLTVCRECPQTALEQCQQALVAQSWHISFLDLCTFLFKAPCPLQGILNFLQKLYQES